MLKYMSSTTLDLAHPAMNLSSRPNYKLPSFAHQANESLDPGEAEVEVRL